MRSGSKGKTFALYALVFALVVALDQGLKAWTVAHIPLYSGSAGHVPLLPGIVHLTYIQNNGAAFGMMRGGRWLFLALLAAFCVLVIWALLKDKLTLPAERWLAVLAMSGAFSNGIDRAVHGYVVDMFELEFMKFAIFNPADFTINVACILFVLIVLLRREPGKK